MPKTVARKSSARGAPRRAGRVALVGRPNVGKSTLLNGLLGERVAITSHHPQTTRDRLLGVLTEGDTQYVFVDTPGLHRARNRLGAHMNKAAEEAAREADLLVFMTDAPKLSPAAQPTEDAPERPRVRPADAALLKELAAARPANAPVLLVVNKVDRVQDKSVLLGILEQYAALMDFRALVPISARKKDGLDRVKKEIRELLPVLPAGEPFPFEEDALTDRPVRYLVAELVREQVLKLTREEVPHGVAVVVDRYEEGDAGAKKTRMPRIQASIHVDREGHKKIVVGKAGAMLKEIGTQARARIERLVGGRVHLELWVRVTPGWYDSPRAMSEMGYP